MKRYRKVMGLAIVLVALAVAINALAFSTAKVTNTTTITVKASENAALAIDAASGQIGTGVSLNGETSGAAAITISDWMQPGSTYKFTNVFSIKNKTTGGTAGRTIYLNAPSLATGAPEGVSIKVFKSGTPTEIGTDPADELTDNTSSIDCDIEITLPSTLGLGTLTLGLVINGHE